MHVLAVWQEVLSFSHLYCNGLLQMTKVYAIVFDALGTVRKLS
jgi:hypothetical protein